jgi:hypothetical protein
MDVGQARKGAHFHFVDAAAFKQLFGLFLLSFSSSRLSSTRLLIFSLLSKTMVRPMFIFNPRNGSVA